MVCVCSCLVCLLGQIVHGAHKVHDLEHVHAANVNAGAAGHLVRLAQVVLQHAGGAAHEVVEEVVHDLDKVHYGLAALDDLTVQRGLDV